MRYFLLFLTASILFSCSIQKRKYQPGYYVNWKHESQKKQNSQRSPVQQTPAEAVLEEKVVEQKNAHSSPQTDLNASAEKNVSVLKDEECDNLIFRDGTEMKVRIIEKTPEEIKYRRCDVPDGPIYSVKKSTVFMIKYSNGTREVFSTESPSHNRPPHEQNQGGYKSTLPPKTEPMAVLALIFGILGIWPLTLLGSIAAIVLGTKAKQKIERHPDKYKGEGMAVAGQVLGIIMVSIFVIILIIFLIAAFLLAFI